MKSIHVCDECRIDEFAPVCVQRGLGIEVQSFYDPAYIERQPDAIEIHRQAIAPVASRSFHGPFGDLCPGSFDSLVRHLARRRIDESLAVARKLDIPDIVLHHGYYPGTSRPSSWIKRSTVFWKELLADTPKSMRIHLENLFERDTSMLSDLIDAVGDDRLDVCLDVGHAHCHSRLTTVEWVEQLGNKIGYLHLHSNNGESDEHLALGEGTVDMEAVCHALEEYATNAIWGIEVSHEFMIMSLDWLERHNFAPQT